MTAIVDGHAHVWTNDNAYPWQPTFGYTPTAAASPESLLADMDRAGVAHAVLVQPSVYGSDHRFLFDTVCAHRDRFLPLGLVDPADPASAGCAYSLVQDGGCIGIRVNLSPDVARARTQARGSGWTEFDALEVPICVRAETCHHELVTGILADHPQLRVVVDHLGLPDPRRPTQTKIHLAELARFQNCWLKIAGLARLSKLAPPYRDLWTVIREALQRFGASRLVWGSDFPVVDPEIGYVASIEAIESMSFMTGAERDKMMSGTSRELWGVPRARTVG